MRIPARRTVSGDLKPRGPAAMNLPPVEHVLSCSLSELQQLELAALDLHSQCIKRAESELKQAIAHREVAGVYRFLIDQREDLIRLAKGVIDGKQQLLRFPEVTQVASITRRSA